jgi:hypothetical protein
VPSTDDHTGLHPGGRHLGGEEYLVRLRAMPSDVPPIIRLRHALKRLLRDYELRCRDIQDVTPRLTPLVLPPSAGHADGAARCGDR